MPNGFEELKDSPSDPTKLNGFEDTPARPERKTSESRLSKFYHDTPYLDVPERAARELPGALEGAGRMLSSLPAYVGGGVAGGVAGAFGGPDAASAVQEAVQNSGINPLSKYLPDTSGRTKNFQEIMSKGMESAGHFGGLVGEQIATSDPNTGIPFGASPDQAIQGRSIGQFGTEAGLNFLPIPGAKGIKKGLANGFEMLKGKPQVADTTVPGPKVEPQPELTATAPEPGKRDRPEIPQGPEDRPGNQPGVYPNVEELGRYTSQEPTRFEPKTVEWEKQVYDPKYGLIDPASLGRTDPNDVAQVQNEPALKPDGSATQPKVGEEAQAQPGAGKTTMTDAGPLPEDAISKGLARMQEHPKAEYTQLIPTNMAWKLRDHNRLTEPKSLPRWKANESEFRKGWQWDPVEIKYSTADGKAVITNGNHRVALNVKYGIPKTAARVVVTDKPLTGTEARTGVDIGSSDVSKGDAKPSDLTITGESIGTDSKKFHRDIMDEISKANEWFHNQSKYRAIIKDYYDNPARPDNHPAAKTDIPVPGYKEGVFSYYSLTDIAGVLADPKAYLKEPSILQSTLHAINELRKREKLPPFKTDNLVSYDKLQSSHLVFGNDYTDGLIKAINDEISIRPEDGSHFVWGKLTDALKYAAGTVEKLHPNPVIDKFLRSLAHRMSTLNALDTTKVSMELDKSKQGFSQESDGMYHPDPDIVGLAPNGWRDPKTLIHESLHAVFVREQHINPDSIFSRGMRALYQFTIKALKEDIEKQNPELHITGTHPDTGEKVTYKATGEQALHQSADGYYYDTNYGFKNEREFVAELSSPRFRELLESITLDKDQIKHLNKILPLDTRAHVKPTIWQRALQFMLNLFGREYNEASMLDQVLRFTNYGLETVGQVSKDLTQGPFQQLIRRGKWEKQAYASAAQTEGPKGIIDTIRQFKSIADKPLKEVMKKFTPDKVEDIGDNAKIFAYANIDRVTSILSEGYKGAGDLIKWVTDKLNTIDRTRDVAIESALKGDKFEPGPLRGFTRRAWGDDGALTAWRKMMGTDEGMKDLRSMLTSWLDAHKQGMEKPLFENDRQLKVYETVQNQLRKALDYANVQRQARGLDKINPINSYFPSMVHGDYRVLIKNADGAVIGYRGFDNLHVANKFKSMLVKEVPNVDISDPYHITPDKYKLKDLAAFEETIKVMGDDPVAQAVQKVYSEVAGKRGAGSHGIKKDFVWGFEGSEAGEVGVRNAIKGIESYIRKMYTYGSNLEKSGARSDIADLPLELRSKLPNAINYANDYIEVSRGGQLKQWLQAADDITDFVNKNRLTGTGESAGGRRLSDLTATMGVFWLFTTKFMTTQLFQPLNAVAKMIQMRGHDQFGNVPAAMFKGLAQTFLPSKESLTAVDWARRNGYLSPIVTELMHTKLGETPLTEAAIDITRWTLGKLEQEAVRLPTFLMFENGLRGNIKDPISRYQEAAELTGHYMVNYNQTSKPMIYNMLGKTVGQTAAPLKTFSHNFYGQFFEYVKDAKHGELAPLTAFVATNLLVSGIKGTILVSEAAMLIALVNFINAQRGDAGDPWPSPEEYFLTHGWSNAAVYGMASTITGQDMSMSLGASGLKQMLSLPPAQFAGEASQAAYEYATKSASGTDTIADRMRLALALTPTQLKGYVEQHFTEPGHPVPNPRDPQGRGNYVRTEQAGPDQYGRNRMFSDWTMAKAGMGRSVMESRANALNQAAKRDLLYHEEVKAKILDAIGDRVRSQQPIDKELIQSYVREGGSPNLLHRDLVERMRQQKLDYMTRAQTRGKTVTPERGRQMQIIQPKRQALQAGKMNGFQQ